MNLQHKGQIGFYVLFDSYLSRDDIRTVINLETIPMPEQFAAEGHYIGLDRTEFWKRIEDVKMNYCHRFYVYQYDFKQNLKVDFVINFINGDVTLGLRKKLAYNGNPIEISEKVFSSKYVKALLSDHIHFKGVNIYRQRFLIEERKLPSAKQPLNQCDKPYYDEHEIQWNIMYCQLKLLDDIALSTTSRAAKFTMSYPHPYESCKGAIIKECESNKIKNFYEIKPLT